MGQVNRISRADERHSKQLNRSQHDKALVLSRAQHCISRKSMAREVLTVLYRLRRYGYTAYLVGGSVRDLLLHRTPKDFDVATNARPNRIRKLFRNSFLIGRRFRLVHVKFKNSLIEVSTFRRLSKDEGNGTSEIQLKRSDNSFGTPQQDAWRRDFTINALFYNIENFSLIDYTGGHRDLQCGLVKSVGNPHRRFKEDPVRMLRAIRAASRLGFAIEKSTYEAIKTNHLLIKNCPISRIQEELHVLFRMGAARSAFLLLYRTGLLQDLMPGICQLAETTSGFNAILGCLSALDRICSDSGPPFPETVWGALFIAVYNSYVSNSGGITESLSRNEWDTAFKETSRELRTLGKQLTLPRRQRASIRAAIASFPLLFRKKPRAKVIRRMKARPFVPQTLSLLRLQAMYIGREDIYNRWKGYLT